MRRVVAHNAVGGTLFEPLAKARASLTPGTVYAVAGEGDWIYYGQVMANKRVGFFKRRDRVIANVSDILCFPVMAQVGVGFQSIGRALRFDIWKKMGRFNLHADLLIPSPQVQWPVGTLAVTVWSGGSTYDTTIDDPPIQDFEIIAAWDAEHHIPKRLTADFGEESPAWYVGGPVLRARRVKEEYAKRCPDLPWHQLPPGWVATDTGQKHP
jgi:hypothetical protein